MNTEYMIVKGELWLNEHGSGITYMGSLDRFPSAEAAFEAGCKRFGHDDFNTAELVDGKLHRWMWDDQVIDEPREVLEEIGRQICIEVHHEPTSPHGPVP